MLAVAVVVLGLVEVSAQVEQAAAVLRRVAIYLEQQEQLTQAVAVVVVLTILQLALLVVMAVLVLWLFATQILLQI
jgi:O-antigen/teichoic acid export membrane protein